jgi:hypothetical protein
MTTFIKTRFALASVAVVGASSFLTTEAHAGFQFSPYEYCGSSGGTSYCEGTFLGFRDSSNDNSGTDYVEFVTELGESYGAFIASYNGTVYSCTVTSGSPLLSAWPSTIAASNYFYVSWTTPGVCSSVNIYTSSYYSESW